MRTWFALQGVSALVILGSALGLSSACSSNGSSPGSGGGTGIGTAGTSSTLPPDTGICAGTCEKDCSSDNDCDTAKGELCCDLGVGKVCRSGQLCPRSCMDDSTCSTATGEACLRTSLESQQKICTQPSAAVQLCFTDTQCSAGEVCCANYSEPICLPPSECPKSCAASTDCNTASGEVCCTSVQKVDSTLKASGLCLNPQYNACPKACAQSSDCIGNASGSICCDGVCSLTCEKQCQTSNDCTSQDARLCCKSASVRGPKAGVVFTTGPTCVGTPLYTSCAECSGLSCCSNIPGCTSGPSSGTCFQELTGYPCFENISSTECTAEPGCIWDDLDMECTGTPTEECPGLTSQASCNADLNCFWETSTTTTCTGTPTYTSCSGIPSTLCNNVLGCGLTLPAN